MRAGEVDGSVAFGALGFAPLDRGLEVALGRWRESTEPVTVLASGGVDSGLLAWELRTRPNVTRLTVGVEGSPDLREAEESSRHIPGAWLRVVLTVEEIRATGERVGVPPGGLSRVERGVLTALAVAIEHAPSRTVLCGQGADELFLGYAHFRGLGLREAASRSEADLSRLRERDWPLARDLARSLGHELFAPYLDPEFVRAALSYPIEQRLPGDEPKRLFRRWAVHRGLPAAVAGRPKRALQYGSGVDRAVTALRPGEPASKSRR